MASVTGLTAARMIQIEAQSVVDGDVVSGNLILTKHDGSTINAGSVIGPAGPVGPSGPMGIPGEIKLWPGAALPNPAQYGHWAWANGDIFDVSAYPVAAANIAPAWKTANGLPDPGAGKFRVPDLRGLVPVAPDAMPTGAARANRVTRPEALTQAARTGEEKHVVSTSELPSHTHVFHGDVMPNHDHGFNGTPLPVHGHAGSTFSGSGSTGPESGHTHKSFQASPGVRWSQNNTATGGGLVINDINNGTGSTAPSTLDPSTGQSTGHTHGVSVSGGVTVATVSAGTPAGDVVDASAGTPSGSNDPTGSGTAHENMQPTIFVPYIVKLD
jgi:microcystin-dependent protein